MTPRQRIAVRLTFILITLAAGLVGFALIHEDSLAAFSGTYYGANETWVNSAVGATFPQIKSTACTVADAAAFTNYIYLMNGKPLRFTSTQSQADIESDNQRWGASQWGYASPVNAVAGITNIAPDFGNDPRSAAYMSWTYNLPGVRIHNYIYRLYLSLAVCAYDPVSVQHASARSDHTARSGAADHSRACHRNYQWRIARCSCHWRLLHQ